MVPLIIVGYGSINSIIMVPLTIMPCIDTPSDNGTIKSNYNGTINFLIHAPTCARESREVIAYIRHHYDPDNIPDWIGKINGSSADWKKLLERHGVLVRVKITADEDQSVDEDIVDDTPVEASTTVANAKKPRSKPR